MAEYLNKNNFYAGADYGLDPDFGKGESFLGFETSYRTPASQIGITTDARSANQLGEVSKKLSTGVKTIELGSISNEVWESVPKHQLKEINRLKKLTGVDLTLHGPLVEPTGVSRQGWDESQREQSERQMWSAVQRAQNLDPDGNVVVTFHSSNGLPTPETSVFNEKTKKEEIKEFWVVDERTGNFQNVQIEKNYFEGQTQPYTKDGIIVELKKKNEDAWNKALQSVSFHAHNGSSIVRQVIGKEAEEEGKEGDETKDDSKKRQEYILEYYKKYGTPEGEKVIKNAGPYGDVTRKSMQELVHGELYLRDAYGDLRNLFNQAYEAAKINKDEKTLEKLDSYIKEISPKVKDIRNPEKIHELATEIINGINVLKSIDAPKTFTPLRDFAIKNASETISNVAMNAYNEFKDKAPLISIENPPAGMGLSRAEDLKDLIVASRKKFVEKAKENGMSESQAKDHADKLIGATWDVGHINMLRKFGYGEKELLEETGKIAKYVKHVHLSDNFGLEHTELPMGMGNVPIKKEMEILNEYNKKAKKIIETGGNWYQFFQKSPLRETLEAFGSPIYGMKMQSYWNQVPVMSGGYFAGQGATLPDIHFQTYGTGFSGLPTELGGQIGGRSRVSGNPME
jgi:sugar phosphate isomerase/epimerase